jgi:hypothetical protein
LGVKDDLRHYVEMYLPSSVAQAVTLASVQEYPNDKIKPHHKKYPIFKHEQRSPFNGTDLLKAGQLKEYIRLYNISFKCGEKYIPAHTCAPTTSNLNVMETSTVDGCGILFKELLAALEPSQMFMMHDNCFFSLHALSGRP